VTREREAKSCDEAREEARGEERVRIMHYSWWLLGLREKGLYSISVFEASTLPPRERGKTKGNERDNEGERKKDGEAKRASRGNGFS